MPIDLPPASLAEMLAPLIAAGLKPPQTYGESMTFANGWWWSGPDTNMHEQVDDQTAAERWEFAVNEAIHGHAAKLKCGVFAEIPPIDGTEWFVYLRDGDRKVHGFGKHESRLAAKLLLLGRLMGVEVAVP